MSIIKKIKVKSSDSVSSVNEDSFADIELSQRVSLLPELKEIDKVNIYNVFLNEREKSDKYRLIFTLNSLCSNVLFNVFTEIVKNEGDGEEDLIFVDDNKINADGAIGDKNPNRIQMIRNTEYSNDKNGFTYHCGYDIFNNHLLRKTSFKTVNFLLDNERNKVDSEQEGTPYYYEVFNTIKDLMRYNDGEVVKYSKRKNVSTVPSIRNKHLYEYKDIINITDSINNNLIEDNGWFGFTNGMNISNKEYKKNTAEHTIFGDKMNLNCVINNKKSCEFIDMYPDRTLFSFVPKVNKKLKRLEYNWKFCITYPYKKLYNHMLISSQNGKDSVNGLYCYSCESMVGNDGSNVLMFRTKCRHGISSNDYVAIYAEYNGSVIKIPDYIKVKDIGNLNKKYKEYYFYILNNNILNNIFGENYNEDNINDELKKVLFRIRRVVNGFESEYYIRLFKKLPNLKYSKKLLTKETGENSSEFSKFVEENATDEEGNMFDFDSDLYKLAFASNIYTDSTAQITYLDTIDIENMVDLNGIPLHELYLTIIKNNAGYEKWYDDAHRKDDDVEYSHCFGKITSGFELMSLKSDIGNVSHSEYDSFLSDVHKLHNIPNYYEPSSSCLEDNIKINGSDKWYNNTEAEKDVFYGDLVEFNITQAKETVLENVFHRFNTSQRETDKLDWNFIYDEITSDDYDNGDFSVTEYSVSGYDGCKMNQRPEGYYYQAHHKILVKELSSTINQEALETISVSEVVKDGETWEATIVCNRKHGLKQYDMVNVINAKDDSMVITSINRVNNAKTFVISVPNIYSYDVFRDGVLSKGLIISKINENIPKYAFKVNDGSYRYLWRNVQRVGDVNNSEIEEYPFTNGCFYIHSNINLYLKRQDYDEKESLYFSNFPNDVHGDVNTEAEQYEYVNEEEVIC